MKKLSTTSSKHNSGQALLVILLAMSVVLTVALSVSSRSITDITTTTYEEDALRAFSAAEAGIEETLLTSVESGTAVSIDSEDPSVTYLSEVTALPPSTTHRYQKQLNSGEVATFWLVEHGTSGYTCSGNCTTTNVLDFCWGDGTVNSAIEILLFYDDTSVLGATSSPNNYANVAVKSLAYDSDTARADINGFEDADVGCWSSDYAFSTGNIDLTSIGLPADCSTIQGCLLFVGARMHYNGSNGQYVALQAGGPLPAQGIEIQSTGEAGDSTRKVKVVRGYFETPHGFWGAMFGKGNLGS